MGFFGGFQRYILREDVKQRKREGEKVLPKFMFYGATKKREREDMLEAYVRGIADWHGGACYVLLFSSEKRRILSVREALIVLVFPVSYL